MKIISASLASNRDIAEILGQILDQDKDKPIYFVGYNPSMELVTVIDTLIQQGYCQNTIITNFESRVCDCGEKACACKRLREKILPDNLFIFNQVQHPDLVKIIPKLGVEIIWVINTDHPQQNEIVQWISS